MLPFNQRKKQWEKHRAKSSKARPSVTNQEIVPGTQVCMKSSPMYQAGAIGMLSYILFFVFKIISSVKWIVDKYEFLYIRFVKYLLIHLQLISIGNIINSLKVCFNHTNNVSNSQDSI